MAKLVKRRRGTTTEHTVFTGSEGEITIDLDKETVVVHNGVLAGGYPLAREDLSNVTLTNLIGVTQLNLSDGTSGQVLRTDGSGTISFGTIDTSTTSVGGDISGTVANAQIVANAITATELATNAVTTVKVTDANITTAKIATDAVTTAKIVDDAVTTAKLNANAVTTAKITDANVTAAKLASDAVTTAKITDLNVTTGKIAASAITTAKITAANITTALLATDSVTTIKITDLNVTAAKIAANSITTTKIADDNVTNAKIATGITSSKLSGALPALDGAALTNLPYDAAFVGGYDNDMVKENIAVATYGELVMTRAGTFVGEAGYIDTVGTGANVVVDILKNGTTIYSTKPLFAVSTATITPGVISVTAFASGDRITFKVTQIGSSATGQGVRFTLKAKV